MSFIELLLVTLSWLDFELHRESNFWLQQVLCLLEMWLSMLENIEQGSYSCSCLKLRKTV